MTVSIFILFYERLQEILLIKSQSIQTKNKNVNNIYIELGSHFHSCMRFHEYLVAPVIKSRSVH